MKNNRKALLLVLCAVMMITASIFGTLAYLTDSEAVANTFTVGAVGISLDEAKVNQNGEPDGTNRWTPSEQDPAQEYHLLPGHEYTKDPTVVVDETSESCYVFVKVENGIVTYEAATETTTNGYKTIADQIIANGWAKLEDVEDVDNVYYKLYTKNEDNTVGDRTMVVFSNFKISGTANTVTGWANITPENTQVNVTAYAIQKDGFNTPVDAWTAGNKTVANGGWN